MGGPRLRLLPRARRPRLGVRAQGRAQRTRLRPPRARRRAPAGADRPRARAARDRRGARCRVNQAYAVPAVAVVVLVTVLIGGFGLRLSRTTSDFYVASRTVGPALNAAAISGEYLSAASFLGIAGLVLLHGPDMLWYPVGYTAGYLVLLLLVAAPLRRSGAYTLPDFAEGRLESVTVRRAVSGCVVGVGWLYLLPQLQGAGLTLAILTGAPRWFGGALVATVVVLAVAAGGMRSITFVQAFQYWLKLSALLVPAFFLLLAAHGDPAVPAGLPAESGYLGGAGSGQPLATSRADHPLYATYGLIVATFLGTMGLPHVVVRFYTSPDGRTARRTTVVVLALLGAFYLLPPLYGWLGTHYAPELSRTQDADAAVLLLPGRVVGGLGGDLLGALVAGGAFAAFLSTASGLTMAVTGVLTQDVLPPRGLRHFRLATVVSVGVPLAGSLLVAGVPVADAVGMAFRCLRLVLLPAPRPRHLVAPPHPARRSRGAPRRRRQRAPGRRAHRRGRRPHRLAAHPARLARRVERPRRLPRDGPRLARDPQAPPAARGRHDGPPPPPRGAARRGRPPRGAPV
ncbi:LOW QUALITY PROTEIN: sodium:solute symporter family protein, partial [Streptomyces sp. SPB074]